MVKAAPPAPPAKPVKRTVVDHARPFVEQLVAEGTHDWHLVARFPLPKQASMVAGRLRKAFPACEWKPVIGADQSGLYVRPALAAQSGWHPGIASLALSQIASGS